MSVETLSKSFACFTSGLGTYSVVARPAQGIPYPRWTALEGIHDFGRSAPGDEGDAQDQGHPPVLPDGRDREEEREHGEFGE